jgi:hypothetical protein
MLTFSVHLLKTRSQTVLTTQSGSGGKLYIVQALVHSHKHSCNIKELQIFTQAIWFAGLNQLAENF